jgi:hypothetical protein
MSRCEYNPTLKVPALEPPGDTDCPNEATVVVGAKGQWHLCESCAALPDFKQFRKRGSLARPPSPEMKYRLEKVNRLLRVISEHGRRFFSYESGLVSQFEFDPRGRLWWVDGFEGERVYTHTHLPCWEGFNNGGTLQQLAIDLQRFIWEGTLLPPYHLGPWPDNWCGGDLWAYGDDMVKVRRAAVWLGITKYETEGANHDL